MKKLQYFFYLLFLLLKHWSPGTAGKTYRYIKQGKY